MPIFSPIAFISATSKPSGLPSSPIYSISLATVNISISSLESSSLFNNTGVERVHFPKYNDFFQHTKLFVHY